MPLSIKPKEHCQWDAAALGEVMLRLDPGECRIRTARQFSDGAPQCLIGTEAEQRLRGGVQIAHAQLLIQQEHAGDQTIEQLGALDVHGI